MNAAHIVTTSLKAAASAANGQNTAVNEDAASQGDAAPSFGLMLGEQIDAAALLGEKTDPSAQAALTGTADAIITPDPTALGMQLNVPPASAASHVTGHESLALAHRRPSMGTGVAAGAIKTENAEGLPGAAPQVRAAKDAPSSTAQQLPLADTPLVAAASTAAVIDAKPATISADMPQALAALSAAQQQAGSRAPEQTSNLNLSQPVGSERWNTELGQTVNLLIKADQSRASLHVTPPEMGPIEIKIDLSGDQASVSFTVQQADTRQALENALPRLREMLSESGISLGQSQVNHQSSNQAQGESGQKGSSAAATAGDTQTQMEVPVQTRIGLVDTFA